MVRHHTKDKGDLGVAKTLLDLTEKGYVVFTPLITEHLPFDLVAYDFINFYKIQVKYRENGVISDSTSWNDINGNHKKFYKKNDFDLYKTAGIFTIYWIF